MNHFVTFTCIFVIFLASVKTVSSLTCWESRTEGSMLFEATRLVQCPASSQSCMKVIGGTTQIKGCFPTPAGVDACFEKTTVTLDNRIYRNVELCVCNTDQCNSTPGQNISGFLVVISLIVLAVLKFY